MDISNYFSLEFLVVILSVIFLLILPKILITIARKSKVGFMISVGIACLLVISVVIFFVMTYNYRYSLDGQNYVYGRITNINSKDTFVINSTKGTYEVGSVGNIKVKIGKDTKVYSDNLFENIKTVDIGDFVTVVCTDEKISNSTVNAIKVIRNH